MPQEIPVDDSDQRSAPRFRCRCYANLDATPKHWDAHLINVSISGALVAVLNDHRLTQGQPLAITIEFDDQDITLRGEIAHVKDHYIGIHYAELSQEYIDQLTSRLGTEVSSS